MINYLPGAVGSWTEARASTEPTQMQKSKLVQIIFFFKKCNSNICVCNINITYILEEWGVDIDPLADDKQGEQVPVNTLAVHGPSVHVLVLVRGFLEKGSCRLFPRGDRFSSYVVIVIEG